MNKIVEALKKLLPEDQLNEVAVAIDEMLAESVAEITKQKEAEFNAELEKAYAELSGELGTAEKVGEQGYEEAAAIITDLRNRLEVQKEEFEKTLEEGYEEAYQHIQSEKAKNNTLEVDLYEEYETKYGEMRDFFVEMIDKFLETHGIEIYEQARRDILSDPRTLERQVALDKIIEIAADWLSDEEIASAKSGKLEEAHKKIDELTGQVKLQEVRTIRLSREKERLEESIKQGTQLVTEARKSDRKERAQNGKNVSGRGHAAVLEDTRVIAEYNSPNANGKKDTNKDGQVLVESLGGLAQLATLAGTIKK